MKILVIGAALATLLASPAFAQSFDSELGGANTTFPPGASNDGRPLLGLNATDSANHYAYEPAPKHAAHVQHPRVQHNVKPVQRDNMQN